MENGCMVSGSEASYSFLGPAGTFTEAALAQVPEAQGKPWRAANQGGLLSLIPRGGVSR